MKKLFLLVALVAALIPAIFTVYKAGGLENWQAILPKGTTDSLYYYSRIHEVADGHPLVGSPYTYEYRGGLPPAAFLPDIIAAIPVILGLPFDVAMVVNMAIWSFVFLFLAFKLLRLLIVPKWWALAWSLFAFLGAYSFMLRPTVMQIVYPVFLAFLIVLLKFLYEPLKPKRRIYLAAAAALSFYIYTYLAYVVFLTLILVFIWFLVAKRFRELRSLAIVAIYSGVMLIPFGIYTYLQMQGPYYFETLSRLGVVYTHLPSMEAFFYARWVIMGLAALALSWFLLPRREEGVSEQKIFWVSTGTALIASLFLNVITGAEFTLGAHVGRLIILWMVLVLGAGLFEWSSRRTISDGKVRFAIASIFLLVLFGGVVRNVSRGLDFFKFDNRGAKIADLQSYAAPLRWLEENVEEELVVWANDSISEYIPISTKHYPLYFHGAVLHSASNTELEDRFLLSKSFENLTVEDLKRDFGLYSGAGPLKDQPRVHNQKVKICQILNRFISERECSTETNAIALRGEKYFEDLMSRFKTIKSNRNNLLEKFNVDYLLIDRAKDKFGNFPTSKALYDDGRFAVLPLPL